jgi:hypothetical protein
MAYLWLTSENAYLLRPSANCLSERPGHLGDLDL